MRMKYYLKKEDRYEEIDIEGAGGKLRVSANGKQYAVDLVPIDEKRYSVVLDNRAYLVEAKIEKNAVHLLLNQCERVVQVLNPQQKLESEIFGKGEKSHSDSEIRAPMPGLILRIEVEAGQEIAAGQPLLVIEAMKMENEIRATFGGMVKEILVQPHQAVERNDILIKIGN